MGRPAGWMKQLTGRDEMRSPGAPSLRREVERQFWVQIATGITSEKAADAVGVSQAVGSRWFRHRGGMSLFMSKPVSGRYLSFAEREEIGLLRAQDVGVREIARRIGRSPSTVSRELTRNAATRGGMLTDGRSRGQCKLRLSDATNLIVVTVSGSMAGHQSRLQTACRSTSRMTLPCASPTKLSTRRSISRAEAPSSVNL